MTNNKTALNPIKKTYSDTIFDIVTDVLLVIALLVVLYPLYFIVIASVSDASAINSGKVLLFPKGIGFESYQRIFHDSRIWKGYLNTTVYTVFGTLGGLAATLLAGYSLSRNDLIGRNIIMKVFIFTMYFSGGLIPTYLVVKGLKLTNTPFIMMILGTVSVFNIIISKTFFEMTIPKELLEASFIDGCSNGKFFLKIVLPISKAIIAVIALYYAVGHWNSYFNALIYLSDQKLYPLQLILRDILLSSQLVQADVTDIDSISEMQKIAETIKYGVIIVSSLPVLILYPFVQKYFVKGIMIGSIKG